MSIKDLFDLVEKESSFVDVEVKHSQIPSLIDLSGPKTNGLFYTGKETLTAGTIVCDIWFEKILVGDEGQLNFSKNSPLKADRCLDLDLESFTPSPGVKLFGVMGSCGLSQFINSNKGAASKDGKSNLQPNVVFTNHSLNKFVWFGTPYVQIGSSKQFQKFFLVLNY